MYSPRLPRLYKYRDSYVLYLPTVHAFGSIFLTHTLLVYRHPYMTFPPPGFQAPLGACRSPGPSNEKSPPPQTQSRERP